MKRLITILIFIVVVGSCIRCEGQLLAEDKRLHFFAGNMIAAWSYLPAYAIAKDPIKAGLIATGGAAIGGAVKEWRDSRGHGNPELLDWVATVGGGIAMSAIIVTFHAIYQKPRPYFLGRKKRQYQKVKKRLKL